MPRGDGQTCDQLLSASQGAVFVWCNEQISYPKDLASYIGRKDIQVVPRSWLSGHEWRGRDIAALVLDHALYDHLTYREIENANMIEQYRRSHA